MALKKSKGKVYASNVKKSLAIMGKKTIATAMPSLTETVVSTKEVFNDIRQFSVRERSKMNVAKNQQRRTLLRPINEIIMNAKEDLKSGKWYNEERIYESEMSDMDSFIDDMSGESSSQESGNSTSMAQFNKFISSTSASSKSSARAIADTQIKTAEYLGELSSHQHIQTLVMSRKNHLEHMNKLDNLEKIGMSLAEFNIKTMTQHIQKTETFYDSMLRETSSIRASVERLAKSIDDRYKGDKKSNKMKKNPLADIFGGGAFDMTGYKNLVKENLSNQFPISKDMMDMIFKNFKNSPVSSMMMLLGSSMVPGGMKGGAKKLDTAAQGLFRSYIEEMNRWRSGNTRAKKGSTMDSLMQFIGQIAGIDPAKMGVNAKPDLSIYKNQAMTLEMENKKAKAIIEVIPSYLSEMLKIMSKGKTDKYFDYDSGKFADRKKARKDHDEAIERKLAGTMSETYGYMDKKIYSASRKYAKDEVSQKTIEADFKTFMAWLSTTNFDYDPARMPNNPEKYYALCKKAGLKLRGGAQSYSFIHAAMVTMSKTQYESMKNERMSSKGFAQDISNRNSIDVHSSGKSALYNGLSKTGGDIKEGEIALVGNPADMKKFMSESILSASELKDYKKKRAAEEGKEYNDATENLKNKGTDVADKIFKKLGINGLVDTVRETVSTVTDKLADGMDAVSERLMEYEDRISGVEVDNSVGYRNWSGGSKKSVTPKKVSSSSPKSKVKIASKSKKYKTGKKSYVKYSTPSPKVSSPVAEAAVSGAYDYRPYFDTIDSHLRNIATILAQNKTFEVRTSSDGTAIGVMGGGGGGSIDFSGMYSNAKEKASAAISSIKKTFSGIKSSISKYAEDHDVKGKASGFGGKAKALAAKGVSSGLDLIGKIANGVKSTGGNIAEYLKSDDFKSILTGMKEKASAGATKIKEFNGTLFEKMASGGIGNMLKKAGAIGIGAFLSNKLGLGPVPGALIGALFSRNKKNKKSESEEDKEVKEMTETMEEAEGASSGKKKGLGKLKAGGNLAKGAFASSMLGLGPIPGLLVAKMYNKHKDKKLKEQQDADIKEGEEIAENVEETEKTKKKGLSKFKKGKNMFVGAYVSSMLGLGPIPGLLAAKMWNNHKDKKAQEKDADEATENVEKTDKKIKGLGKLKKLKNVAVGALAGTLLGNPVLGIAGALAYNKMKDKKLKKKNAAKAKTEVNASVSPGGEDSRGETFPDSKPTEDNPKTEGKAGSIASGATGLAVGGAKAVGRFAKGVFGKMKSAASKMKSAAKEKIEARREKSRRKSMMGDVERARDLESKGDHAGADRYEKKLIDKAKHTGDIEATEQAQSIVANTRIPGGTTGAKEKPKNPKVEGLLSKMGGVGGILSKVWDVLKGIATTVGGIVAALLGGLGGLLLGKGGLGGMLLGGLGSLLLGLGIHKAGNAAYKWLNENELAKGQYYKNEQGDTNFADYSDKMRAGTGVAGMHFVKKGANKMVTPVVSKAAGWVASKQAMKAGATKSAATLAGNTASASAGAFTSNAIKMGGNAITSFQAAGYDNQRAKAYDDRGATTLADDARSDRNWHISGGVSRIYKGITGQGTFGGIKNASKKLFTESAETAGKNLSKKASTLASKFKKGLNNIWKKLKPILNKNKKASAAAKKVLVNNADEIGKTIVKKAPNLLTKILGKLGQLASWVLAIIPLASALVAAWKGWNNADADLGIDSSFGGMWKLKILNAILYALDDVLCGVLDMIGLRQWLLELLTPVFLNKKEEEKLAKEQEKQQKEYDKFLQENDLSSEALTFDMYNKMDNGSKKQKKQLEEYKKGGKKNDEAREKYGGYTGQQAYSDMNAGQQIVQNVGNKLTGGNYVSNAPSTDIRAQVADLMSNPEVKKALESANYVSLNYFNNTDNSSNANVIANSVSGGAGGRGGTSKSNSQILKEVEKVIHNSRYGNSKSVRKVTSEDMDDYQGSEFYKEDEKNEKAKNETDKKKSSADKKTTLQKVGDLIKKAGNWIAGKAKKFWGWLTGSGGRGPHSEMFNSPDDIIARGFIPYLTGSSGSGRGETVNGYTYYNQKDSRWGNQTFGKYFGKRDTVRAGGCGPTVAAMALENITGAKVSPSTMAKVAMMTGDKVDDGGTSPGFFNKVGSVYGVNFKQTNGLSESAVESLKMGTPVPMLGKSGPYGNGSHYLLATNMDNSGRVSVLDPQNRNNNKKYSLRQLANTTQSSIVARGRVIPRYRGPVPFGRSGGPAHDIDVQKYKNRSYVKRVERYKNRYLKKYFGGRGNETKFGSAVLDRSYIGKVPDYGSLGTPEYIIVHYTAGSKGVTADEQAKGALNYHIGGADGHNTSAHFYLGETVCYQGLECDRKAAHCPPNTGKIGIETGELYDSNGKAYFSDTTIENLLCLVKYLMNTYNIDINHVKRHKDFCNTSCPGPFNGEYRSDGDTNWNNFLTRLGNYTGQVPTQLIGGSGGSLSEMQRNIVNEANSHIGEHTYGSLGSYVGRTSTSNTSGECMRWVQAVYAKCGAHYDSGHPYQILDKSYTTKLTIENGKFNCSNVPIGAVIVMGPNKSEYGHAGIYVGNNQIVSAYGSAGVCIRTPEQFIAAGYPSAGWTTYGKDIGSGKDGSTTSTTATSNKSSEGLTKLQALAQSVVRDDSKFAILTSGLSDIYQTVDGSKSSSSSTSTNQVNRVASDSSAAANRKITDWTSANVTAEKLNSWINSKCIYKENENGVTSKMRDSGQYFIDAGNEYGIDPRALMALAAYETGYGTSKLVQGKNNFGGIGHYEADGLSRYDHASSWSSASDGIKGLANHLKNSDHYIKAGKDTFAMIQPTYCPSTASEGGVQWINSVPKLYQELIDATGGAGGRGVSILPYSVKSKIASMAPSIPKRMKSNGRGPQLTAKSAIKMSRGMLSARDESFSDMQSNSRGSSSIYGRGDGDASTDSPYKISLNGLNARRSPSSSTPKASSSGVTDDKLILVLESIVSLLTDIKDSNQEISEKNFSPVVAVQGGGGSTGMALGRMSSKQSLIDSIVSGI